MAPARRKIVSKESKAVGADLSPSSDGKDSQKKRSKEITEKQVPLHRQYQYYYPRQYGGLLLGTLAALATAYYDKHDDYRVFRLIGWLIVMLIAAGIHELRPYKRKNYGDLARENGVSPWSGVFGMRGY